jgi:hypothetical protein
MSYTRTGLAGPLDPLIGAIKQYIPKVGSALEAGKAILDDPALPKLTGYVLELKAIQTKRGGAVSSKGVGLSDIITPVRYYVAYQKNRWIAPVALALIIGLPFYLGYATGKKRRGS